MNQQFVTVARVIRPRGRRGEIIAEPYTNRPEQFAASRRLQAVDRDGQARTLELEEHWFHKERVVLKFRGVDSINQAEELRGCELRVSRDELVHLEAETFYVGDLVGCTVLNRGSAIGIVVEVQFGAGEAPLLVVRSTEGKELLIPFAQEYLLETDVPGKRIQMNLPQRLLELDAPLTEEEKQAQRRE